jgi:hypothetical protein
MAKMSLSNVEGDELEQLLRGVERIADGLEGMRELFVSGPVPRAPGDGWLLDDDEQNVLHYLIAARTMAATEQREHVMITRNALRAVIELIQRRRPTL